MLILDTENSVENHRTGGVEIDFVGLHFRLLFRSVRVPSVDLELLQSDRLGFSGGGQGSDSRSNSAGNQSGRS